MEFRESNQPSDVRVGLMTSVFIFATLGPIVVTALVVWLVGRARPAAPVTGWSLAWRTVLAGALVPVGVAILSVPTSLFGGHTPNTRAQAIIFSVELAVVAVIALPMLVGQWYRYRKDPASASPSRFVRVFGPLYLIVLAALWISASPDFFTATPGTTADGTPTGNLAYASICFVVATLAVCSVSVKAGGFFFRTQT
jgi:hypothetical protein